MMKLLDKLNHLFAPARLSRSRIILAVAGAMVADVLQIALLPVAWTFAQSAVDVVAMVFVMSLLGFHLLLLPTFVVELIPYMDMLPTWTGCVMVVIALRKRAGQTEVTKPPSVVDISATVTPVTPPELPDRPK